MRFALNALHLVYGERDGVETEFEKILQHLARLCEKDDLLVLANTEIAERMSLPDGIEGIQCPVSGSNVLRRVWYEHRHVSRVCVEHNVDAALFLGAVLPVNLQIPGVLLINDMQPDLSRKLRVAQAAVSVQYCATFSACSPYSDHDFRT